MFLYVILLFAFSLSNMVLSHLIKTFMNSLVCESAHFIWTLPHGRISTLPECNSAELVFTLPAIIKHGIHLTQLGTFSSVRLLLLGLAVDLTMLLMAEDRVGDWCFCVALHLPVLSAILFLCLSSHFFLPICCLSLILSLLCPKKGVFLAEVRSLMPIGKDAQNVTGRGLREDKFGVRPGKSSKGHPDTFRSHRVVPP